MDYLPLNCISYTVYTVQYYNLDYNKMKVVFVLHFITIP